MSTPVQIMVPGEVRVGHVTFAAFPELAWYGDGLTGTPTVTVVAGASNTGSLTVGTATLYPTIGIATEARFLLTATGANDGDTYLLTVGCSTVAGSTLEAPCQLNIKAQP